MLGFGISFVGSLPIGALNLTAIEIAVSERYAKVLWFALGVVIIEYIQAYFAILFSDYLMANPRIDEAIQIAVIPLFFIIGLVFFFADRFKKRESGQSKEGKKLQSEKRWPPLVKGIALSVVNPLAIPYWVVYSTSLKAAGLLVFQPATIHSFIIGVCAGTFIALAMFGGIGELLTRWIEKYKKWFNEVIGLVFIIMAIIQLLRVCGVL